MQRLCFASDGFLCQRAAKPLHSASARHSTCQVPRCRTPLALLMPPDAQHPVVTPFDKDIRPDLERERALLWSTGRVQLPVRCRMMLLHLPRPIRSVSAEEHPCIRDVREILFPESLAIAPHFINRCLFNDAEEQVEIILSKPMQKNRPCFLRHAFPTDGPCTKAGIAQEIIKKIDAALFEQLFLRRLHDIHAEDDAGGGDRIYVGVDVAAVRGIAIRTARQFFKATQFFLYGEAREEKQLFQ